MSKKTKQRTPQDTMSDLIGWLFSHEADIANGVNDFGELRQVFKELTGKDAKSVIHVT